jgi:nucleoside-diphosphate-sugar epimerase
MVVLRSSKSTDGSDLRQEVHLVTGGGGYAGFWLGRNLAARGHRVILIDVRDPIWTLKENMKFMIVSSPF